MGLFDKLTNRKDARANLAEQNTTTSDLSSIEKAIAERGKQVRLNQCLKISLGDVAALGSSFSQMIPSLRTIKMNGVGYIPVNMGAGDVLKKAGEGLFHGAHVTPAGSSKLTKWAQVGPTGAVMPINPAMIMMTAMLVNIEKKLDIIQETQMRILSFLEHDKQAEQRGDLNVLTNILRGYKHNWDNSQYRQNHHMKTLDIKQASEKNIIFYWEQIASEIKVLPVIYVNKKAKIIIAKLEKLFRNYRMALYLFAFSSFLELLLLGNFREEYLSQVAEKIQEYTRHYQTQLSQGSDLLEKFISSSLETKAVGGLGNASKALGDLIASVPLLSRNPLGEWLQDNGIKVLKGNDEKISKTLSIFAGNEKTGTELFIENIQNISVICNRTSDVLFDDNTLYLATT